jgi:hypothetical protein
MFVNATRAPGPDRAPNQAVARAVTRFAIDMDAILGACAGCV